MARHRGRPRPGTAEPTVQEATLELLAEDGYDPDLIDEVAERQRAMLGESPAPRVWKLRCSACTILIGPGYHEREAWLDLGRALPICRGCAHAPKMGPVAPLLSAAEVAGQSVGDLSRLIKSRTRQLVKEHVRGQSHPAA